jgi:hypothetical protein
VCRRLDPYTTPSPNYYYEPYSYGLIINPWINRKYPEPLITTPFNYIVCGWQPSNAIIDANGREFSYEGDSSLWTRPGYPAMFNNAGFYLVPDHDGNNAPPGHSTTSQTAFRIESRVDNIKNECQLWVSFASYTWNTVQKKWILGEFDQGTMYHSNSLSSPFPAQLIITLPGSKFKGPDSVELMFGCVDPCSILGLKPSTWEITGQGSYVTKTKIKVPLENLCDTYGSFKGSASQTFINCKGVFGANDWYADNISEVYADVPSGPEGSPPACYAYHPYMIGFRHGGGLCNLPVQPCTPGTNKFSCCNTVYGGYRTLWNGRKICDVLYGTGPGCVFNADLWTARIIDEKTATVNGMWQNSSLTNHNTFNCFDTIHPCSKNFTLDFGTLKVTGV